MSPPRLFSTVFLRQNTDIVLRSDQARYVGRVLRLRTGDQLTLLTALAASLRPLLAS